MAGNRHVSGTATRVLLEHLRSELGEQRMLAVVATAGDSRPVDLLLDDSSWSSYSQFRSLLEAASGALGSAEELQRIADTTELHGGSMPEGTEALLALGSPSVLFEAVGEDQNGLFTVVVGRNEQVAENEWRLLSRLAEGYEPFPEFCAFLSGMVAMGPLLFGRRVVTLEHETCQMRGDEWCTNRLAWAGADESSEVARLETKVRLVERRSETLRRTVAELVSTDDLHTVLTRVVESAARATRAPAFLLALEAMPYLPERVYAHGLGADEAAAGAQQLLSDGGVAAMVVDVASSHRFYGRLAALDPHGTVVQRERVQLEAYARLAATALDSATALEEARRQSASARALLDLSTALAEVATSEAMAANVARAIPLLLDCDAAAVALIDDGVARIVGTHGFEPEVDTMLRGLEVPVSSSLITQLEVYRLEDTDPEYRPLLEACGFAGYASIPVFIDGEVHGTLVAAVTSRPERLSDNPELRERMTGLAGQASTALRNARLLDQIRHQALHDELTGLPNRALLMDRAEFLLQRARRQGGMVAAIFIDLDSFKEVNDTLGHAVGDGLLRAVAHRLSGSLRECDTIARLGGDEFVVLSEGAPYDDGPELLAERLLDVLRVPFKIDEHDGFLEVTASIGIAVGDRPSADVLLRDADIALYQAKAGGKNGFTVFAPEMYAADRDRLALHMDLRGALRRDEFFLVYQPIFDLRNEAVTGVEALLRWQHPERGTIGPDVFIPLLEDSRLIKDVGRWVLTEACRQTMIWHQNGDLIDVSVNVSGRQLEGDGIIRDVSAALTDSGLPAHSLILEITESVIMKDVPETVGRLAALKALGVRIAIDDFGTGYSSLAYLRQFPVDALKIDRSFISAIADSEEAGVMISTLVQLGKALGLETFAEGIEERAQFDRLQREDCDSGQGFLFARPLLPCDLLNFLDSRRPLAPTAG